MCAAIMLLSDLEYGTVVTEKGKEVQGSDVTWTMQILAPCLGGKARSVDDGTSPRPKRSKRRD